MIRPILKAKGETIKVNHRSCGVNELTNAGSGSDSEGQERIVIEVGVIEALWIECLRVREVFRVAV